jgi:TRAP-type C4-dicarboxylate transport system permease small subunit
MSLVRAFSDRLDRLTRGFMIVALGAIVVLFLGEVFARNVVGRSLTWVEEVSVMYLGTWLVFIGAAHAMKIGMLVTFEYLLQRAGPRTATVMLLASEVLIIVFLLVIVVFGLRLSLATMAQPSPALRLPVGLAYLGIVVGCGIMIVHTLAAILQRLAPKRQP